MMMMLTKDEQIFVEKAQKVFEKFRESFDSAIKGFPTPSYIEDRDESIHALLVVAPLLFKERDSLTSRVRELEEENKRLTDSLKESEYKSEQREMENCELRGTVKDQLKAARIEIARSAAENQRLREAAEPFAKYYAVMEWWDKGRGLDDTIEIDIQHPTKPEVCVALSRKDFRALAQAALKEGE